MNLKITNSIHMIFVLAFLPNNWSIIGKYFLASSTVVLKNSASMWRNNAWQPQIYFVKNKTLISRDLSVLSESSSVMGSSHLIALGNESQLNKHQTVRSNYMHCWKISGSRLSSGKLVYLSFYDSQYLSGKLI